MNERSCRVIQKDSTEEQNSNRILMRQLVSFCNSLHKNNQKFMNLTEDHSDALQEQYGKDSNVASYEKIFEWQSLMQSPIAEIAGDSLQAMYNKFGFEIVRKGSSIEDGGTGVFVSKGSIPKNSLVAIYPGTLYHPGQSMFFQSLSNSYFFRCLDGVHIDGKDKGLSKLIYNSLAEKNRHGPLFTCDKSWLTEGLINPLSIGQYINNHNKDNPANVAYHELNLSNEFPFDLKYLIPNVHYNDYQEKDITSKSQRIVILVSLREIYAEEELFSSYFTIVTQ